MFPTHLHPQKSANTSTAGLFSPPKKKLGGKFGSLSTDGWFYLQHPQQGALLPTLQVPTGRLTDTGGGVCKGCQGTTQG